MISSLVESELDEVSVEWTLREEVHEPGNKRVCHKL